MTKAKTVDKEYLDPDFEWNIKHNRKVSLDFAFKLYTETHFKQNLVGPNGQVNDVPFFILVENIEAFINTGKFPALETLREQQKVTK